jgi:predicted transcriptional regulator
MATMLPPKQASIQRIEHLEDDASYEDILYELYFLRKVQRGLEDVEAGRTTPHEDVRKEFEEWLR